MLYMNDSSAQPSYSVTSDSFGDTITLSNNIGVIAQEVSTMLTSINDITISNVPYYTYTAGASGSVILGELNASTFTWKLPEEWVDAFPDYNKVKEMCDTYPAFKIAFEKFKQMYDLVEDDYEAKKGNKYVP